MRHRMSAIIFAATVISCAAQNGDVFSASNRDTLYRNPFLGFSWNAPYRSEEASAVDNSDKRRVLERNRKEGILLQSERTDFFFPDPSQVGCCSSWAPADGEVGGSAYYARGQYRAWIVRAADSASACGVLNPHVPAERKTGGVEIRILRAPYAEQLGAQAFCRADWNAKGKEKYQSIYIREYVTIRRGYAVIFQFRADTERELKGVAKSMASVRFEPDPASTTTGPQ